MPDYEQVYQHHGGRAGDFVVLGVNLQEGQRQVEDYATGLGLTCPVLLDEDGRVTTRQYQVTGMPASFIIDRQGVIFYRHLGPMYVETLQAKLAELGL
jgi:cytochrome c biogenesis protein CcmG/thiol:disulfide interchange protein DsbE